MSANRLAISAFALVTMVAGPARADMITDWNAKAEAIAIEKRMMPPPNARMMAIMHIAMFEAVNAVDKRYAPYRLKLTAGKDTSKEAAAAAAAHTVLTVLHPDQQANLDATLKASLAAIADGGAKTKGIELGAQAGAEILALRANDGMSAAESYRPHTQPGVYVPTVIPVASTTGAVTPWVMEKGAQFRPGPPPPSTRRSGPTTTTKSANSAGATAPNAAPSRPISAASGSSRGRRRGIRSCARSRPRRSST